MKSGTECERCAPAVEICGRAIRLLAGVSPECAPCCFLWVRADSEQVRAAFNSCLTGRTDAAVSGTALPRADSWLPGLRDSWSARTCWRSPHRGTKLPGSTAQFCPAPLAATDSGAPPPARGPPPTGPRPRQRNLRNCFDLRQLLRRECLVCKPVKVADTFFSWPEEEVGCAVLAVGTRSATPAAVTRRYRSHRPAVTL